MLATKNSKTFLCEICGRVLPNNPRIIENHNKNDPICKRMAPLKEQVKKLEEENLMFRKSVSQLKEKLDLARSKKSE